MSQKLWHDMLLFICKWAIRVHKKITFFKNNHLLQKFEIGFRDLYIHGKL